VKCAGLGCLDSFLHRSETGDHDDFGLRRDLFAAVDHLDAADIRQVEVRQDNVEVRLANMPQSLFAGFRRRRFKSFDGKILRN